MATTVRDVLRRTATANTPRPPGLSRFAVANTLSHAADTFVAVSLAGSLFFNISADASQEQVLIYLVVNMVPFTLLAPLIGPAIDRFGRGHKLIATVLFALRALCAIAVAFTLLSLALYFFVLSLLVLAKASGVVRQALIPGLVEHAEDLVAANARLARLGVIAGGAAGAVGVPLATLASPAITLALAALAFLAAAAVTSRVPEPARGVEVTPTVEYEELHAPRIVATAWAFTAVRAAVGFFTFGLAFALRRDSQPAWMYAAAAIAYGAGSFLGNMAAPVLRTRYREIRLVAGSLLALAVVAVFAALGPSRPNVLLVATVLGGAASIARQGFDSMVQSQAPEATRARSFARFETRFQIGWVLGAIAAVAGRIPLQLSMAIVALALAPSATFYLRAIREARDANVDEPFEPTVLVRRRLDHAIEWHRRGMERLVVTDLASVLELIRVIGHEVPDDLQRRVDGVRIGVISGLGIDETRFERLLVDVEALVVATMETAQDPDTADDTTGVEASGAPSSASPGGRVVGATSNSSKTLTADDDHSSPRRPNVTVRREN
ncbi:MAG: MFS transporter [Desertimonas sp.]